MLFRQSFPSKENKNGIGEIIKLQKGRIVSLLVVLLFVLGLAAQVKAITLAENGVAQAVIVIDQNAPISEQHAASELADFLQQVTGAEFEILHEADTGKSRLLVGPQAAKLADPNFSTGGLGAEGIVIRTVGDDLILAGGYPRGTLYAVYTFLEDQVGCHWWSSTASTIPNKPSLEVSSQDVHYVPRLEWRETLWYDALEGNWSVRNKCNGQFHRLDAERGGKLTYAGWFVHTFNLLIPPGKYFSAHPEWYSKVGGTRTTMQLCLTNEEMRTELVKNLKARLLKNPDATITSVSQNDRGGNCQCSNCAAIDNYEGSPAGSLLHFVNAVAEDIEAEFPNMLINTLAYQYTRKPPKYVRPRHNVVIQLCSIECSFSKPLSDSRNSAFRNDLIDWSNICDRLYVWDYTTNFSHYVMPHPNLRVLGPNVRFFADNNVKSVFEQGAYQCQGAEMAELRAWVLAKLMWDPALDDQQLIDEFLNGYYGPAAVHIKAYLNIIHDAVEASGDWLGCNSPLNAKFLSFGVLNEGMVHLKAAEQAVEHDPELRFRVQVAQLPVIYVFILRWDEMLERAVDSGTDWPMPPLIKDAFDHFVIIAQKKNITRLNESEAGYGVLEKVVGDTVEHDYIQRIINASADGDEIVMSEGVYNGSIDFKGKNLILRSTDPNNPNVVAATIIDGGSERAVVSFSGGEDANCLLAGFTIVGGNNSTVHCYNASPIIANCIIDAGTGIAIDLVSNSNPTLTNCTVIGQVVVRPMPENLNTGKKYGYIQDAIDDANTGDVIIAPTGIYEEHINFKGKNLKLRSTDPNDPNVLASTVIEGALQGPAVVTFSSGGDRSCVLAGFTITGGSTGIYCSSTSPTIVNCDIIENGGDGIYLYKSLPKITSCIITTNGGAGIQSWEGSNATITNCAITNNGAEGIYSNGNYFLKFTNCLIAENRACGMDLSYSNTTITNCTISGNGAEGIRFLPRRSSTTITNCIVWGNLLPQTAMTGPYVVTYSDIQGGWAGQGNIETDPCFVEQGSWDPNQGLVSYWRFDEGIGTTAADSVGDNNGIIHSAGWTAGKVNGALSFDSVDDYVDIGDKSDLDLPGRYTFMFWVKFNSVIAPESQCVLSKEDYATARGYSFQLIKNKGLRWRVNDSTKITVQGISTGLWAHVAVTTDGTNDILYVNGTKMASAPHTPIQSNNKNFMFGRRDTLTGNEYLNGTLDEAAIYSRGLPAEEIQLHYQAGLSGHGFPANPKADELIGDGDYHLLPDSPCIDTGDPNYIAELNETDFDGLPRIIGGRVDMGAYEFNHIPVADAGPNQVAYADHTGFAEVTLDGSASYDDDGHPLTYLWTWTVDGNTYEANGVSPTIQLPVGEHTIELIVNDGIDDSEPNQVVITVIGPMQSYLWIFPQVIHRNNPGPEKITALLSLPDGITKNKIDTRQPLMLYPGGIKAVSQYIFDIGSPRCGNQHAIILACFDKDQLLDAIPDNGPVKLQAVGRLKTSRYFFGSDTITIKPRPLRPWWPQHGR